MAHRTPTTNEMLELSHDVTGDERNGGFMRVTTANAVPMRRESVRATLDDLVRSNRWKSEDVEHCKELLSMSPAGSEWSAR